MSAITKEQAKDLRNAFQCWQQDYDPVEDKEQYDMFGIGMVAMDALLASLEAEPVGEVVLGEYDDCGCHPDARVACIADDGQADWENFKDGTRLYTAPPAPVSVPDEATPENIEILASTFAPRGVTYQWDKDECNAAADSWNAGRAAMLQGADGNSPVIPDWQAKAEKMAEIHGSSFVLFRNGESPQCADPTKVIISFTDEGLGHGSAAPQQEVK